MPEYPWDRALPAAVAAIFRDHPIAEEVVITGGVAIADWWFCEYRRHDADGIAFTLSPRFPTRDIDTVVRVIGGSDGATHINVVASNPKSLQQHLEQRGWTATGRGMFTCSHLAHGNITIDLVTYRTHDEHQHTVTSLGIPGGVGGKGVSVARVLPPCLKEMYFIQPFGHTQFAEMGLRRHNHAGLLLAKMSAVGTNLVRWRQAAADKRPWPDDLQRIAKDSKDLTDLLHLQVRTSLRAFREVFERHIDDWAWVVYAFQGGFPPQEPVGTSLSRARSELAESERALRQWLAEMRMTDVLDRAGGEPPPWTGTSADPRNVVGKRDLRPPPV